MSKRFPIPEFNRDQYKNMEWKAPRLLTRDAQQDLIAAARKGDEKAYGCYPVEADPAFFDRFRFVGPHRHAVMCLVPPKGAHLAGRSWAWPIQRALVVDSLDPQRLSVLQEWTTPRPMNTRLGPDEGVPLEGGVAYVVFGHRYGNDWIVNRTLASAATPDAKGFSVLSASDDAANDFHACNLSFTWA